MHMDPDTNKLTSWQKINPRNFIVRIAIEKLKWLHSRVLLILCVCFLGCSRYRATALYFETGAQLS